MINELKELKGQENPTLIQKIDMCIYRNKGSLRISDNEVYYKTDLLQISFQSKADADRRQKAKDLVKNKIVDTSTNQSIEKATEEYLKKNNLPGWKFRCAKAYKNFTLVNLDR
jgi:hypothetical protein